MKNSFLLIILILTVLSVGTSAQDKLAGLRTQRHIVTMEGAQAPYYSIQILALKEPPSDADFFKSFDLIKEYPCEDGFVRYCVGDYANGAEALSQLESVRSKGYPDAFVVNTKRLGAGKSNFSSSVKIEIKPDSEYLVQLSAFRFPVYISFFKEFDRVLEFKMSDKIFRYTTLPVKGTEVEAELSRIKGLGYRDAFIVEKERYMPFRIE